MKKCTDLNAFMPSHKMCFVKFGSVFCFLFLFFSSRNQKIDQIRFMFSVV